MNTELLIACVNHFKSEPLRLDMTDWLYKINPEYPLAPACGTVGCIAGTGIYLEAIQRHIHPWDLKLELCKNGASWSDAAMVLFEISEAQAEILFYTRNWPQPHKTIFLDLQDDAFNYIHPHILPLLHKHMVNVLESRVMAFINSNGKI